ncbi:hypothetical protein VTO42DRAFT_1654 [Malbranchea cinnamomea]
MSDELSYVESKLLLQQVAELHDSYGRIDLVQFRNDVKAFLEGNVSGAKNTREESMENKTQSISNEAASHEISDLRSHLDNLQRLIELCQVRPEAEDFIGGPIRLSHRLNLPESDIHESLRGIIEKKISLKEREANLLLSEYTEMFGNHPLVHAACREYFTTELWNLQQIYWRPDPRGHRIRLQAQEICSQAIAKKPWLNQIEKRIFVHATGCFPQDAESFWRHMTRNRLSYLALEAIKKIGEQDIQALSEIFDVSGLNA